MYSLQAFPTEKVLKDFTPYRGIILSSKIEFNCLDEQIAANVNGDSHVKIDITPILSRIAKAWKYNLALLQEGKGETGVANHSWTTYAKKGGAPELIRWQQGDAQIIMAMGNRSGALHIMAVGNEPANAILEKFTLLFSDLTSGLGNKSKVILNSDKQSAKTVLQNYDGDNHYLYHCTIVQQENGELSPIRSKDYLRLLNSCSLWIRSPFEVKSRNDELRESEMFLRIPERKINYNYDADNELSQEMLRIIYDQSIIRSQGYMTDMISRALDPNYGSHLFDAAEDCTNEDVERIRWMDTQCKALCDAPHTNQNCLWKNVSAGIKFSEPEHLTLRGTAMIVMPKREPGVIQDDGDLIDHLVHTLLNLDHGFIKVDNGGESPEPRKMKIKARVTPSAENQEALGYLYRKRATMLRAKLETISNPYFSVHMGMPVRIDQSVSVWREGDTEALACDVWFDVESRHLHAANLYKIKVPQS